MTAREKLCYWGFEDVAIFDNPGYDDALIGVSHDNRAIYDYDKMVTWLMDDCSIDEENAREFIDYNAIRALPYIGSTAPIVLHRFPE